MDMLSITHNHTTLEHLRQSLFHTVRSDMGPITIATVAIGSCHD